MYGIFPYMLCVIFMIHVGNYIPYIDPMGYNCSDKHHPENFGRNYPSAVCVLGISTFQSQWPNVVVSILRSALGCP